MMAQPGSQVGATQQQAANPMAAMMQEMGGLPAVGAMPEVAPAPAQDAALNPMVRARFAGQLAQLSAMGFCNEQACLRALLQHQGRVDAAIDALLLSGESM